MAVTFGHVCRLYFALALLILCLRISDAWHMAWLCILLAGLIRGIDGHGQALRRMLALLQWLLLPILLIHALFSPGEVLWSFSLLQITREGLQHGVALGLHLLMLFLAGMSISRLWSWQEWLLWVARLPWLGRRIYPYVLMLMPLRREIARSLSCLRLQWQQRSARWRDIPLLLEASVRHAVALGSYHADMLWLRWGSQPTPGMRESISPAICRSAGWAALGTGMMVWEWWL